MLLRVKVVGLQAALEQERAARSASSSEVAAAEAAARAAAAERDARARDLLAVRAALHDTSEKLAAASAERDMNYARVSDAQFLAHFFYAIHPPRVSDLFFRFDDSCLRFSIRFVFFIL